MSSTVDFGVNSVLTASAVSYAAAAAHVPAPAKYVPVHRRGRSLSDATSPRSPSPTPSEASSTCTLVSSTSPSTKPRVYSIATLLELSHDPEIKLISLEQRERVRQELPDIVMNRKMRKAIEYHAIQERVRAKTEAQAHPTDKPIRQSHPQPLSDKLSQQRQRPWQRRQSRSGAERKRNASKVVDEASWRTLRLPSVAAV